LPKCSRGLFVFAGALVLNFVPKGIRQRSGFLARQVPTALPAMQAAVSFEHPFHLRRSCFFQGALMPVSATPL
jgi:hypothetical protein